MNAIENWLLNVFLGKVVARAAVTVASALAAGPVHEGLAAIGLSVDINQTAFAAGVIGLGQAAFEWYKKKRLAPTAPPAPPVTKAAIAALLLLGFSPPVQAAWDFSAPKSFGYSDSSAYVKSIRGGSDSQLATGGCYGPMLQLSTNGNWVADFLSACVYAAAGIQGQGTTAIPAIQLINFWGLRGGIGYDGITSQLANGDSMGQRDRIKIMFGVSVIGALKTVAPAASTIMTPVVNVVTSP